MIGQIPDAGTGPVIAPGLSKPSPGGWFRVAAATAPLGGGLMKLGGAATWLAASVALAPYAVCAVLCSVFVIGYAVALLRFVWSGSDGLDAMEHVLAMTANAIVGILTLTQVDSGRSPERGPDRTAPAG